MIRAVLFDLDGTLLHSAPDLVAALNQVRTLHCLPEHELEAMQQYASRGAVGLLQAGMPAADPDTLELWRHAFLAHYEKNSARDSALFEGIVELLAFLDSKGVPWGIVTNKPEYLTRPVLAAFGLDRSLGCLVCGDTIDQRKPHPAPVRLACEVLGVSAADTLMVGDDVRDLQAGMAAGVKTCAVLYGYGSNEFSKAENEAFLSGAIMVESPRDLMAWLQNEVV